MMLPHEHASKPNLATLWIRVADSFDSRKYLTRIVDRQKVVLIPA